MLISFISPSLLLIAKDLITLRWELTGTKRFSLIHSFACRSQVDELSLHIILLFSSSGRASCFFSVSSLRMRVSIVADSLRICALGSYMPVFFFFLLTFCCFLGLSCFWTKKKKLLWSRKHCRREILSFVIWDI